MRGPSRLLIDRRAPAADAARVLLELDGVNYRGAVFVDGVRVAGEAELVGTFVRWRLDVTAALRGGVAGRHTVAVDVCTRPWASVAGTRLTWCVPPS